MITIKWTAQKSKKIKIQMEGISASLHLVKDYQFDFSDKIWKVVKSKFMNDIKSGNIEVIENKSETKSEKKKKEKTTFGTGLY